MRSLTLTKTLCLLSFLISLLVYGGISPVKDVNSWKERYHLEVVDSHRDNLDREFAHRHAHRHDEDGKEHTHGHEHKSGSTLDLKAFLRPLKMVTPVVASYNHKGVVEKNLLSTPHPLGIFRPPILPPLL